MAPSVVWLVLAYDPYQYQGRASVCGVYATEEAAKAAEVQHQRERDGDGDEVYVQDYEVECHPAPPMDADDTNRRV